MTEASLSVDSYVRRCCSSFPVECSCVLSPQGHLCPWKLLLCHLDLGNLLEAWVRHPEKATHSGMRCVRGQQGDTCPSVTRELWRAIPWCTVQENGLHYWDSCAFGLLEASSVLAMRSHQHKVKTYQPRPGRRHIFFFFQNTPSHPFNHRVRRTP